MSRQDSSSMPEVSIGGPVEVGMSAVRVGGAVSSGVPASNVGRVVVKSGDEADPERGRRSRDRGR